MNNFLPVSLNNNNEVLNEISSEIMKEIYLVRNLGVLVDVDEKRYFFFLGVRIKKREV